MNVYLLESSDTEARDQDQEWITVGIFSTREAASKAAKKDSRENPAREYGLSLYEVDGGCVSSEYFVIGE